MKVVDLVQRSPEWHAWRRHGVSASDAATILGISPYKTPWRLWAEKTGRLQPEDLSRNPNVRRGVRLEDVARQAVEKYVDECGGVLLPVCVEHESMPWLRASFDGLNDQNEPVELKCPADSTLEKVKADMSLDTIKAEGEQSEAYRLYYPQVQFQMMVVGAQRGYLAFYSEKDGGQLITFTLDLDLELVSELSTKAKAFWDTVQNDKAPPMDPGRDIFVPSGENREKWDALVERRGKLSEALSKEERIAKGLKAELKTNEGDLIALMGDFSHAAAQGLAVTRYEQQGGVDYKALLAEHLPDLAPAELDKYRKEGSRRVKITHKTTTELEQAVESAANKPSVKLPDVGAEQPETAFDWGAKFAW